MVNHEREFFFGDGQNERQASETREWKRGLSERERLDTGEEAIQAENDHRDFLS